MPGTPVQKERTSNPLAESPSISSDESTVQQDMQECDEPATTSINPIDAASETNKEWRIPPPLDNEKEGKSQYIHLHFWFKKFSFWTLRQATEKKCAKILNVFITRGDKM